MLKKDHRLKTEDFKALPETQKKYTENFTIRYKNSAKNGLKGRFAVIAPKKIYKNAVDRNSAKRLVYKAIFGLDTRYEKVFIFINKDILNLNKDQIINEIKPFLG